MKSPEQMGGPPEQSKEKPVENKEEKERKVTTPEEAAEMTRQRRKDFDLEEEKELTQEQAEELEGSIKKLLGDLDQYDFEGCSPKRQKEWYWVEQEVQVGKDRELAKANLERLLKALQEEAGKPEK
ncbi:MAG: hypothetical protein HYW71_03220 [Candidatus Niyogibacteria bacterium]|nr:hypothetical protein [Candidatus Niyogibacteria bacterium]